MKKPMTFEKYVLSYFMVFTALIVVVAMYTNCNLNIENKLCEKHGYVYDSEINSYVSHYEADSLHFISKVIEFAGYYITYVSVLNSDGKKLEVIDGYKKQYLSLNYAMEKANGDVMYLVNKYVNKNNNDELMSLVDTCTYK